MQEDGKAPKNASENGGIVETRKELEGTRHHGGLAGERVDSR